MSRKQQKPNEEHVVGQSLPAPISNSSKQSHVLENSSDSQLIHLENVKKLKDLTENQILEERQQLFQTLGIRFSYMKFKIHISLPNIIFIIVDPSIIKFLQSKRKENKTTSSATPTVKMIEETPLNQPTVSDNSEDISLVFDDNIREWHGLNLNVKLEKEKLQWMANIPNELLKTKPGESYEARFDWKGVLLPYSLAESDDNRELFLHSDDVQRPGYTIQELFRLAR